MITNGSLFDDKMIQSAVDVWRLKRVQITLDGTKGNHESIKGFTDHRFTFDNIIHTISKLSERGVFVSIRINYCRTNLSDVLELIEFLDKTVGHKNIHVYCAAIMMKECGMSSPYYAQDDADYYLANEQLLKKLHDTNYLRRKHFLFKPSPTACSLAHSLSAMVIDPHGNILKCTECVVNEMNIVGNVSDGIFNDPALWRWINPCVKSECNDCLLLPICQGGCQSKNLGENNAYCCHKYKYCIEKMVRLYCEFYGNVNE